MPDKKALMALAEKIEQRAHDWDSSIGEIPYVHAGRLVNYADEIREACEGEP